MQEHGRRPGFQVALTAMPVHGRRYHKQRAPHNASYVMLGCGRLLLGHRRSHVALIVMQVLGQLRSVRHSVFSAISAELGHGRL